MALIPIDNSDDEIKEFDEQDEPDEPDEPEIDASIPDTSRAIQETYTLVIINEKKYWKETRYEELYFEYINEYTAGKPIPIKSIISKEPERISLDKVNEPYPTKFLAYTINNIWESNPYKLTKLLKTSNTGTCKFINSKIKENIINSIHLMEYRSFVENIKGSQLIIIKIDDITQLYNTTNFEPSVINYISKENTLNTQYISYHCVNNESSFKPIFDSKTYEVGKKCYRISIIIYNIYIIKQSINNDTLSQTISSLINKSSRNTNIIGYEIGNLDSSNLQILNEIKYVYYNTLFNDRNYEFNSFNYKLINNLNKGLFFRYYSKPSYGEREQYTCDMSGKYYTHNELFFTDITFDNIKVDDFYPYRFYIKQLMVLNKNHFTNELEKSLIFNSHRLVISDVFRTDVFLAVLLSSNTINKHIRISLIPVNNINYNASKDEPSTITIKDSAAGSITINNYGNEHSKHNLIDINGCTEYYSSLKIMRLPDNININNENIDTVYKVKIEFDSGFIDDFINNKVNLNNHTIEKLFDTKKLNNFYSDEYKTLFPNNILCTKIEIDINSHNKKIKSSNIDSLSDKISIFDKLFTYQKINVNWMDKLEKDIGKRKLFVTTKYKYNIIPSFDNNFIFKYNDVEYCNSIFPNQSIINNGSHLYSFGNISDVQKLDEYTSQHIGKLYIKGGVIADDIGLGKTASMICHLINQLENDKINKFDVLQWDCKKSKHDVLQLDCKKSQSCCDVLQWEANNLIILPSHLVKQWEMEIEKLVIIEKTPIKVLALNTMRDINRYSNSDLKKYDIVLICKNIIYKTDYDEKIKLHEKQKDTKQFINIYNIKWNRIIVDEAHECLSMYFRNIYNHTIIPNEKVKASEYIGNYLANIKSNFRWCITATPFCYGLHSLYGILKFLLPDDDFYTPITTQTLENTNLSIIMKEYIQKQNYNIPITKDEEKLINNKYSNFALLLSLSKKYYNQTLDYLPYIGINPDIIIKCMSVIVKRTTKKSVKDEIKIPEFIEKRLFINFTDIERKMYDIVINNPNNQDISNIQINLENYSDKPTHVDEITTMPLCTISDSNIKTALQLCTNLLIQKYFSGDLNLKFSSIKGDDSAIISLDNLQKYIAEKLMNEVKEYKKTLDELEFENNSYEKVSAYFTNLIVQLQSKLLIGVYSSYDNYYHLAHNPDYSFIVSNYRSHQFSKPLSIIKNCIIKYLISNYETYCDEKEYEIFKIVLFDDVLYKLIEKELNDEWIEKSFNRLSVYTLTYLHRNELEFRDKILENIKSYPNSLLLLVIMSFKPYLDKFRTGEYVGKIAKLKQMIDSLENKIKFFSNDFIKQQIEEPCMICYDVLDKFVIPDCRHIMCQGCFNQFVARCGIGKIFPCPACRTTVNSKTTIVSRVTKLDDISNDEKYLYRKPVKINGIVLKPNWKYECINQYGSKMSVLLEYLGELLEDASNRIIIFSNYDSMLKLISIVLEKYNIKFVNCKGNVIKIGKSINDFKKNNDIRIILLSTESFNSGNNLTEANHVIFIDAINNVKNTVINIEKQAIGRAVRLGQNKGVVLTRFIMRNTVEELLINQNAFDITQID